MKKITFLTLLFIGLLCFHTSEAQRRKRQTPAPSQPDVSEYGNIPLRNLSPGHTGGRVTDIAVNPTNRSIRYVATASGNVWKTVNAGTTWQPIFDRYGSFSIGVVTLDPNDPNVVWLGTGENNSQRSVGYGDGVYKSMDAGKTWQHMGLKTSEHIGKIIVDPRDSKVVYVASQGPLWSAGGERGLYKTTDGGKNWERVLHVSENTGISELAMDPVNPDVLYAASYQRRRHFGILIAGGPEGKIFKSGDAGKTWKELKKGLPGGDLGRIAMAVSPQKPEVVYALIAGTDQTKGFYRSSDHGESWVKKSDYMVVDAQYYMEIFPDPNQFDRVISVDMRTNVTIDGGSTFQRINENRKHVDSHEVVFDPSDPNYIMIGCDGGIYESWDGMNTWRFTDNMPLTQFYRVGIDNAKPFYNIYGGTQDNNSLGGPSQTTNSNGIRNTDWYFTQGGDGFQTRVDPTDENIVYSQYQYAGIVRYDKKSGEKIDIQPQPGDGEPALKWNWDSPLLISPHSHKRLYFAANKLFRSDDRGNTWTAISDDLTRQEDRNQKEVMGRVWTVDAIFKNVFTSPLGSIVALDESPVQEGLILVGTDDGLLRITEDNGQNWRLIENFPGVPARAYVSDVHASRHDANEIFIAFNYHKYGDYKPYVLRSTDKGNTWKPIISGIPEGEFAWTIYQDHVNPDLIFLGTEFGMYYSTNRGDQWNKFRRGIPTIPIRDLEIHQGDNDLIAASFGRGFFIMDDYAYLREASAEVNGKAAHLFAVGDALQFVQQSPDSYAMGHSFYTSPNPRYGASFTYRLGQSSKSLNQERKARESALIKEGKPVPYPSWDELEAESEQERTALVFTIRDANSKLVRRITGPDRKGIHRINWDLRSFGYQQTRVGRNPAGPLVPPGHYTVEMARLNNGTWTDLGEKQSFEVKALNNATLPASDRKALFDFQNKVSQLDLQADDINTQIEQSLQALAKARQKALNLGEGNEALVNSLYELKQAYLALDKRLNGRSVISDNAEFAPPSVSRRIGRVRGILYGTTSEPTTTQKESLAIAEKHLKEIEIALKNLEVRLSKIDQ
ncbi:MAG: glycosyl hydrolase [Roseivirga sp.]|nr:glycosyl hydrolase [Roseivirga sp.]